MKHGRSVLKRAHNAPHKANSKHHKKQFSKTAAISQSINSDSGPKSLMRGGIRL